jgi:hypothetical protein
LELPTALEFLIPSISKGLGQPGFEIDSLSQDLDVATFFAVIQGSGANLSEKINFLTEFLQGYELPQDEQELIHRLFVGHRPSL